MKVTIGVGDPQARQFEVVVDTGSTCTAVPRELFQRLGVPVERSLPSETAVGRTVPVDVGRTTIRLEGLEFSTPVIFAEEGEPSLLGVVSLEEAVLAVDPLAGRSYPQTCCAFNPNRVVSRHTANETQEAVMTDSTAPSATAPSPAAATRRDMPWARTRHFPTPSPDSMARPTLRDASAISSGPGAKPVAGEPSDRDNPAGRELSQRAKTARC